MGSEMCIRDSGSGRWERSAEVQGTLVPRASTAQAGSPAPAQQEEQQPQEQQQAKHVPDAVQQIMQQQQQIMQQQQQQIGFMLQQQQQQQQMTAVQIMQQSHLMQAFGAQNPPALQQMATQVQQQLTRPPVAQLPSLGLGSLNSPTPNAAPVQLLTPATNTNIQGLHMSMLQPSLTGPSAQGGSISADRTLSFGQQQPPNTGL